ncbi:hypothetical protein OIU78_020256 [Salix suchowensis]|nr:hypothetical protein OIU78_020256 [Salix suchowensis]
MLETTPVCKLFEYRGGLNELGPSEMSYYPFNNRIKGELGFIDDRVFRLRQEAWRQQRARICHAVILNVLSTSKFTGNTGNEEVWIHDRHSGSLKSLRIEHFGLLKGLRMDPYALDLEPR